MSGKGGYIYILTNKNRNVLYIGVTSDLANRICEHKSGRGSSFTRKYRCTVLLYFEFFEHIEPAIEREKQLKNWHRNWKLDLIKSKNPKLIDLSNEIESFR
jgi:putative endonuclease